MEVSKVYNPSEFEQRIYNNWVEKKYFTPKVDKSKKPFTIVMPPPNITGQLHMGHALNDTLQDIIIRYKRMDGYEALWLPGTDHASIATELKIVEQLKKEGLTKKEIGREKFLERSYEWKRQYGGRIVEQLKRLGASCDWSREAFTMDERCSKAVREVFVNLYEKGLIYKGSKMTHWCPSCGTVLSDAEIEYEEKPSHLWHIKYPYTDGSGYMIVATTRPETMFGDTAVAVNPTDERYEKIIGKQMYLPLTDKTIPVIADEYVEKEFGTGAVKITPAHDPNDYEVGKRHNLDIITVIDDKGYMNDNAPEEFRGLSRDEARKLTVKKLVEQGYMEKIEDYNHNVGTCYRCHTAIEPKISDQWFLSMDSLAKPAIKAVKDGETNFVPKRFEKIYFNWMENIRDWCISRQLWWGHRIPAWYCDDCGKMSVSKTDLTSCPHCKSKNIRQDEDVLDTWFSSALWPFSTLGFPEKTTDLDYFYPGDVLVTAYDIIFFWVARMIFSGIEHMGEVPFKDVLIHGIVRDSQGRKMSKSLGNGIDPIKLIEQYGADALRYSLTIGVAPGSDIRYSDDRMESSRNFVNKIWNASRYVIMNLDGVKVKSIDDVELTNADKWILTKLQNVIKEVRNNLDNYEFGLALAKLYDFVWSDYCDWYIELTKPMLYSQNENLKINALSVLKYCLSEILKLLHPFIPYITEEIWSFLDLSDTIMLEKYPKVNDKYIFESAKDFEIIKDTISKIRNIRIEKGVANSKKINVYIISQKKDIFENAKMYLEKLAGVEKTHLINSKDEISGKVCQAAIDGVEIYILLGELIDFAAEIERLNKDKCKVEAEIARSEKMLANTGFVSKAPQKLIDNEKEKLVKNKELLETINRQIEDLK
ncbi:MAG: valine--tRNA ligase [Clostridia bacterium]|nr:valine--tRNA ligase [Clostridia bacterium]